MKTKQIFKIQNSKTGEFATPSSWSKNGKTWNHISHVKRHLSEHSGVKQKYDQAELVVYEMVEVSRNPMRNFISEVFVDKNKKEIARKEAEKEWMKENLKRQIAESQRKLKDLEKDLTTFDE